MRKAMVLLACLCVAACAFSQVNDDIVQATGTATGYRAAVNEALISALEQHEGITVSSTERQQMTHSDTAVSQSDNGAIDDKTKLEMNDSIAKSMQKWANGKISGYDVVSDDYDPQTKRYRVRLAVRFPGRYVVGLDPDNRKRMAIVEFRPWGEQFSWYGQAGSTVEWVKTLGDKLNVAFTKTRRFTMLDRKFDAEVNDELARLDDANASRRDAALRKAQKLGTDYLVTGEVRFFPVAAPGVNPLTGQPLPVTSQLFAEVTYRVLLAPTGQLKFSDTVRIDAASFAAGSVGEFASRTTDAAAALILDGVMANYQPRDEETDGTEMAPTATPTVNATPVPPPPPPQPSTVRGTGTGGVVTPF